ncbi:hypothetical protein [Peribacillus asahii]|uniref:hypothetical protein n=1 Tax=Peribacillus asahii TaxID=228899 RepID=UPI00207977BE|nr:hypothetical protein [Peribacillus asahii]USK86183.1 hypothetical protein LIT35_05945 [Peribacillus asahii]
MANNKVQSKLSKEELSELYLVQYKSIREIAKMFDCNHTTIGDLLKQYDIPSRPVGGGRKAQIVQIEHNGQMVEAKRCTVCNEVKLLEDFNVDRKGSGGRQPKCKECRKRYYENNHTYINNKSMTNYYKNHEENKLKRRLYYSKHKIRLRKQQREYYLLNHEKNLLANRRYYHANKDTIVQSERLRRMENIEYYREQDRKRYIKRKEQRSIYHQKYYEINKDTIKLNSKKRKTSLRSLLFTLTEQQWNQIQSDFNYGCALSEHHSDLNMEHFIPVSWGHGGTYVGNVYPVHWKINRSKSDTNPFVWIGRNDVKELVDMDKWHRLISYLAGQNHLSIDEFKDFVNWCENNKRGGELEPNYSSLEGWRNNK